MKRFLYSIAKTRIGGTILHWIFAYFSFAIPGEKLIETDTLIAFHHPSPSYPLHILIVPKDKFRSIMELPSDGSVFETGLFKAVKELVQRFGLEACGYRLIANGGSAQEVDHLHFHLVSDDYEGDISSRIKSRSA
jgi:histidine triad (HIT) family protein